MKFLCQSRFVAASALADAGVHGKPHAGNPHVRFDEEDVAPCTVEASLRRVPCRRQPEGRASGCAATPRRGSLLYKVALYSKGAIIASVILPFSLAGLAETVLSFAPEGASWSAGSGTFKFEDVDNWTRNSSGTGDELLVKDTSVTLCLDDDVALTKIKLRDGYSTRIIGFDLRNHTLKSTSAFRIWNQNVVMSNGIWNASSITLGESSVPNAHLTLSNMVVNVSSSSLPVGFANNSLTLYDSALELGRSWNEGIVSAPHARLILKNSSIAANNTAASALKVYDPDFKVLIDGERSNFRSGYILFGKGAIGSELSIRDGVSSYSQDSYSLVEFADGATNNLVTIGPMGSAFYRNLLRFRPGSFGNRVVVESGAEAKFHSTPVAVPFAGANNRIEIDDGTFSLTLFYAGTDLVSSNNAVVLSGDAATFTVARNFIVGNKDNANPPRFEFKPGPLGFNNVAPFRLTGNDSYAKAITNMIVSVDATEYVGKKIGKFKLPLMKFSYTPQCLEIDELNANLESDPEGGRLTYEPKDKTLYWNYRNVGMTIIFW